MKEQKPIRVLIAEDDFMVSKSITRILNDIGCEQVGLASNGKEVVEMTRSLQPPSNPGELTHSDSYPNCVRFPGTGQRSKQIGRGRLSY